jgi:2-hydroxy-4-carboxymuconate semialdehyde hemiacetal dehydrogenase
MSIAIIGTGAIAEVHARAINHAGVKIDAVSGVEPDQVDLFAERFNISRKYLSTQELLEDDQVDAVIVATPSHLHAELTSLALESGKSVLCEVPLVLDLDSFQRVKSIAQVSNQVMAVAQTLRYSAPHMKLKELLVQDPSETVNIIIRNLMFRQENIGWTGVKRSWTDSVLWHHGAHAFDLASWLLGSKDVDLRMDKGPLWRNGEVMEVHGFLSDGPGRSATFNLSYHSRIASNDVVVITESDTYQIRNGVLFRNDQRISAETTWDEVLFDAVGRQDLAFINAVNSSAPSGYISIGEIEHVLHWLARP